MYTILILATAAVSHIIVVELAQTIKHVVAYVGEIAFDSQNSDTSPQKLMDSRRTKAAASK